MARITTLKDNEGNTLYPITSSQAVLDSQGNDLDTRLDNMVEKESGKGLSSNDYTNEDKQKLADLPTNEQLTTTLNGKQSALQNSEDITVNGNKLSVTDRAKMNELIAQWKAATRIYTGPTNYSEQLGGFDEEQGLFTYAGRITLTESEVRDALTYTMSASYADCWWLKAVVPLHIHHNTSIANVFKGCRRLQILALFDYYTSIGISSIGDAFNGCNRLKYIVGIPLSLSSISTPIKTAFQNCNSLEEVWITQLKTSISFEWSENLWLDCIAYMVANAANTAAVTVTVHPKVYAKLTGDTTSDAYNDLTDEEKEQWQGLVTSALEKNIAFATV